MPNSLPHRGNIEIEIYGMEGIPDADLKAHEQGRDDDDEPGAKRAKSDSPALGPGAPAPMAGECRIFNLFSPACVVMQSLSRSPDTRWLPDAGPAPGADGGCAGRPWPDAASSLHRRSRGPRSVRDQTTLPRRRDDARVSARHCHETEITLRPGDRSLPALSRGGAVSRVTRVTRPEVCPSFACHAQCQCPVLCFNVFASSTHSDRPSADV